MNGVDRIEEIARVCHEANRTWCAINGDDSQPPWSLAPPWQKSSAIDGVHRVANDPELGPEASHHHWLQYKLREGWTYGPVKDPEAKRHPCMLPWSELPAEQRAKDRLFVAIARALLRETS